MSEIIDGMETKWIKRFLDMAELVAGWSKDPSTKVGAVIADPQNRVISVGFNGFPRSVKDDLGVSREHKLMRTIHAEENAMLFAQRSVDGCSIYITHHPCASCAAKIIQVGIKRVFVAREMPDRWINECTEAKILFTQANVRLYTQYNLFGEKQPSYR